jgi:hypothetical protein
MALRAGVIPCFTTSRKISGFPAPSAIRTPISPVCCSTEYGPDTRTVPKIPALITNSSKQWPSGHRSAD